MRGSWEQAKQSLSEELEAHLQMAIAERVRNGEDPGQARSAALRELGKIPFVEDVARDHRGWNSLENLLQDSRYALRQLRRAPAFTATAVLTLAFAIGANLGLFQLLYGVILAELPVPHPEEIVGVHAALSPFDQRRVRTGPSGQRPPYSVASNRNSLLTFDLHPTLALAALGIALMLLSLLCFSILPVALFIRSGVAQTAGSRAKVAGIAQTARQGFRSNVLLAAQVSLSLLLSTMSACSAATLVHWETVDVGMDRDHVLLVHPELHQRRYTDHPELLSGLYSRIQERLQALPGVRSTAVEMCGGIHCGWITALYVHGRSNLTDMQVHGQEDHVGFGFFSTLGIPPPTWARFLFERHDKDAICGNHQPGRTRANCLEMQIRSGNGLGMSQHRMTKRF